MSTQTRSRPAEGRAAEPSGRPPGSPARSSRTVLPLVIKVLFLGIVIGAAIALTPAMIGLGQWLYLIGMWVIVAILVATYATGRALPAKYLVPGVLLLTLFVVVPIIVTFQTSTTNFGDGTRGSKEETVARIIGSSVRQTPDAPRYNLTVATTGSVTEGPFAFLLVDPATPDQASVGTVDGLQPLDPGAITIDNGFVRAADGYTILTGQQINAANDAIAQVTVPTEGGAIQRLGLSQAFEGTTTLEYDEAADTITNTQTGTVYTVQQQGDRQFYADENGDRVSDQSWLANVGFLNYQSFFTNPRILGDFLRIFAWTVAFATLSVLTTFGLGLLLAVALNDARMKGQKLYRALLILPYAIPGFIALLVWASFYNRDFGLINQLTGLDINWFGNEWFAKAAVIITNLWMGFPYMFLVCTGALQSIPEDLKEATTLDGASAWQGFRSVSFPLLLVSVAPLLVATFAFNFNNFNAIQLLTEGGPFSPDNPTAGGTDILISYTLRLAFGAGGAQIGFASAVSVLLFILTGVLAAVQFRATRSLEDVN